MMMAMLFGSAAWSAEKSIDKRILLRPVSAVKMPLPVAAKTFKPVTAVKLKRPALIKLPPLLQSSLRPLFKPRVQIRPEPLI